LTTEKWGQGSTFDILESEKKDSSFIWVPKFED